MRHTPPRVVPGAISSAWCWGAGHPPRRRGLGGGGWGGARPPPGRGDLQRIALSATLADPDAVISSFELSRDAARIVASGGPLIDARLVHLQRDGDLPALLADLPVRFGAEKSLLFVDSRRRCEQIHAVLSGVLDCDLHYSNLSVRERHAVERRFRERRRGVCVATSTLELGIDIGDVGAVLLYGPPHGISPFLQRLGRAGRRRGICPVWCLCWGPLAGEQLLRFLGLLRAARDGRVEAPRPRVYPSVLAQQILSSVYAEHRLSPTDLRARYPERGDELVPLLAHMQTRGWLRADATGHLIGGWRYHRARIERGIWSNLPPEPQPAALVVEETVVAELPAGVARQLDPGDVVQLAGRRLRIRDVDLDGERRQVLAAPSEREPTTEPTWLGAGAPVTWDAAQAVRALLQEPHSAPMDEPGLGVRTRRLLAAELARPRARLANGVEVYREPDGTWRYLTWLGSFGNQVLRESIRAAYPDDPAPRSDPLGLRCPQRLVFRRLPLPVGAAAFTDWAGSHLRLLRAAVPLPVLSAALPRGLLVEELVRHLYDPRVDRAFGRLLATSDEVVSGDVAALEIPEALPIAPAVSFPAPGPDLLAMERARWPRGSRGPGAPTSLTAAVIGRWLRHGQCERSLAWWPASDPAPRDVRFRRQSRLDAVEGALRQRGDAVRLATGPVQAALGALGAGLEQGGRAWLLRPRLRDADQIGPDSITGGLSASPDLVEITRRGEALHVAPGIVSASSDPPGHRRWQVVLSALLLSRAGWPVTEALLVSPPLHVERFALAPWRAAAAKLLARLEQIRAAPPGKLPARLGPACPGCPILSRCLPDALRDEPVLLLPDLKAAVREVLRAGGRTDLQSLAALTEAPPDSVEPPSQDSSFQEALPVGSLPARARALLEHQVTIDRPRSRVLPSDVQKAVCVDLTLMHGRPMSVGIAGPGRAPVVFPLDLPSGWPAFIDALVERCAVGACVLFYGGSVWRTLQRLGRTHALDHWTPLESVPRLDLRRLLLDHVTLPVPGVASLADTGNVLGLAPILLRPPSLLHARADPPAPLVERLALALSLWSWLHQHLQACAPPVVVAQPARPVLRSLLGFLGREHLHRQRSIQEMQDLPLVERVARHRALGPLTAGEARLDAEGHLITPLIGAADFGPTRLRAGDFLRAARLGTLDVQRGAPVILHALDTREKIAWMRLRSGAGGSIQRGAQVTLEEELEDRSYPRLVAISRTVLGHPGHPAARLLSEPSAPLPPAEVVWARAWLASANVGLNSSQEEALLSAFRQRVAVIEGPPGTGKTHLLAWTMLALIARSQAAGRPMRIAVTALTHRAIEQLLGKTLAARRCPAVEALPLQIAKLGSWRGGELPEGLTDLRGSSEIDAARWLILGATGQALSRVLGSAPPRFDLVVCDEASQLLAPHAWLALVHGRGRVILAGDTRQLPPIVVSAPFPGEEDMRRSIMERVVAPRVRLEESYRLSEGLCEFPSRTWYDGRLRPVSAVRPLVLPRAKPGDPCDRILAGGPCTCLLLLDHRHRTDRSPEEAVAIARLVTRLIAHHGLPPERIAVLSPHRAQNGLIAGLLEDHLGSERPVVDTVERLQGSERDVIFYGLTASDPERATSAFLTDPRRFNVAITRARMKLIVVGSRAFFDLIPRDADEVAGRSHLLAFERFCVESGGVFHGFTDELSAPATAPAAPGALDIVAPGPLVAR